MTTATTKTSLSSLLDTHITVSGRLLGEARFERIDAASMAYTETGELVLRDGKRLKAVRRYLYRLAADGACVIEFADGPDSGRPFLRFDMGANAVGAPGEMPARGVERGWTGEDDHLCGRDLYQARYRFSDVDVDVGGGRVLVQRTVVSGPRKDYAIVSRLERKKP